MTQATMLTSSTKPKREGDVVNPCSTKLPRLRYKVIFPIAGLGHKCYPAN
jgi:hypothetical protein